MSEPQQQFPVQAGAGIPHQAQPYELRQQPVVPPPMPPTFAPMPPPARRPRSRAWIVIVALVVLTGLIGWQTFQLIRLQSRLTSAEEQIAAERNSAKAAAEAMASRVAGLEKGAFIPDQIAAAALPSVFRIKAGGSSGTAWAVGKPTSDGGAHLFTNFHVVEGVWDKGERKVSIEHKDQLYDARIVKVDEDKDVAQLETSAKFAGLAISTEAVRPGEPVVVVGAPLGLESSVTTGVVSAFRKLEGTNDTYVQFDAAINPGNSGGPVLNSRGQVVGIASAKIRNAEGIGLAIPIGLACELFPICG